MLCVCVCVYAVDCADNIAICLRASYCGGSQSTKEIDLKSVECG